MSGNDVIQNYGGSGQGNPYQSVSAPSYRLIRKRWLTITAVVVLGFWALVTLGAFASYGEAALSTRSRKPLFIRTANDINFYNYEDYISDETGWLDYKSIVSSGLKDFYEQTGILPYVYITDSINGSASTDRTELKAFAKSLYSELFTDQVHLLFVYVYTANSYMYCYECGTLAAGVFDEEAGIILQDYIDKYQTDSSLSNSQFLGRVFTSTADRIMIKTISPLAACIVFMILAAIFAFLIIRQQKKYKAALEELKTKEILQIPLEKFSDPETAEFLEKCDGKT